MATVSDIGDWCFNEAGLAFEYRSEWFKRNRDHLHFYRVLHIDIIYFENLDGHIICKIVMNSLGATFFVKMYDEFLPLKQYQKYHLFFYSTMYLWLFSVEN